MYKNNDTLIIENYLQLFRIRFKLNQNCQKAKKFMKTCF